MSSEIDKYCEVAFAPAVLQTIAELSMPKRI
jgi:hypothetical protein